MVAWVGASEQGGWRPASEPRSGEDGGRRRSLGAGRPVSGDRRRRGEASRRGELGEPEWGTGSWGADRLREARPPEWRRRSDGAGDWGGRDRRSRV